MGGGGIELFVVSWIPADSIPIEGEKSKMLFKVKLNVQNSYGNREGQR